MNAAELASGCRAAGIDGPTAAVSLAMRPHQQAAFDEAVRHLGEHDRVTIALPCGTGKTLLGQRLAQHLGRHGRSAILVLVPSVALLAQTMRAWIRHSPRRLAVFVFCHDHSVSSTDLHVPVSTSAATLASWITRAQQHIRRRVDPQVVVFATYQSSPRIAEAHRDHALAPWHVAVDEAHCAAGQLEAAFATVVHDSKIPAAVRIFLTATPRVRGDGAAGGLCMDDPGMFGPVVAPLPVRAAIDARLLSDYVVAVVTVTDADVRAAVTDPAGSINVEGRAVPADRVATQLAVAAAARAYGLRRIMVFHNSVRFLSCEPLLGPLPSLDLTGIDWLIVGGESGAGFRPLDLDWVRDLRDRRGRAALFFKQVGGRTPKAGGRVLDGRTWDEYPSSTETAS
jgi:superfamily II DNA or RNA helicase